MILMPLLQQETVLDKVTTDNPYEFPTNVYFLGPQVISDRISYDRQLFASFSQNTCFFKSSKISSLQPSSFQSKRRHIRYCFMVFLYTVTLSDHRTVY